MPSCRLYAAPRPEVPSHPAAAASPPSDAHVPPCPCPCRSNDIIVAWQPLPGTNADLTRDNPLNDRNQISMVLTAGAPGERVITS